MHVLIIRLKQVYFFRYDGEQIYGQFYSDDFIYGGTTVSYQNLWPSNGTFTNTEDICSSGSPYYQENFHSVDYYEESFHQLV